MGQYIKSLMESYVEAAMERRESLIVKTSDIEWYRQKAVQRGYTFKKIQVDNMSDGEPVDFMQVLIDYPSVMETLASYLLSPLELVNEAQNFLKGLILWFPQRDQKSNLKNFISFVNETSEGDMHLLIQKAVQKVTYREYFSGYLNCSAFEQMEILQEVREFVSSMSVFDVCYVLQREVLDQLKKEPCLYAICSNDANEFKEVMENLYFVMQYEHLMALSAEKMTITLLLDKLPEEPAMVRIMEDAERKGIHTYFSA